MNRKYTPRRASQRWLAGAPDYVLDVIDGGADYADRYTILFTFPLAYTMNRVGSPGGKGDFADTWIPYLGTSENLGVSGHGEMRAREAAAYRYAKKHKRMKWADLPAPVRRFVETEYKPDAA